MKADLAAVVRRYGKAWAEVDPARRQVALAEIWADDAVYVDPDVPDGAHGREALSDLIEASFATFPGLTITLTGEVEVLDSRARYRWRATTNDGQSFEGSDFVEFGADGRIERVTNFFDS